MTTNSLPPQDLLDKMHQFPGPFVFKAIGRPDGEFAARIVSIVRLTLEQDFDAPFQVRETTSGRHISVTIEPYVQSSQEVINVFNAIREIDGLVMML